MTELTLSSTIVRDPDMMATDMDGETVMMSIEQGEYYGLSGAGPFLWDLMTEPVSIETLCRRVMAAYDVDEATCRADTLDFVAGLLDSGAVRRVE